MLFATTRREHSTLLRSHALSRGK